MHASLESVTSIFEKMSSEGFPVHEELNWGFYFVDFNKNNLNKIYDELHPHGYVLVALEKVENGEYQLHVSKTEKLSPEKLHKRNMAFNDLADYHNVSSYDGWDVEKPV